MGTYICINSHLMSIIYIMIEGPSACNQLAQESIEDIIRCRISLKSDKDEGEQKLKTNTKTL